MEQKRNIVISSELRLFITLLKYQLAPNSIQNAKIIQDSNVSWSLFVSLVIRHRLVTVIYTILQKIGVILPTEEAEKLKRHFDLERKRNFILNASLISLNEVLTKELDILWFKGVTQSQRMYGNPFTRSYSDLDVLIDFKDLVKIDCLLRQQGYLPLNDWTKFSKSHFSKYSEIIKEIGYIHQTTKVFIDVHWNLVFAKQLLPFSHDDLFNDSIYLEIHDKKIRTLGNNHNFYYLNIHGCFDNWKSLSQLFDITISLHQFPELKKNYKDFLSNNKLNKELEYGVNLSFEIFQNNSILKEHLSFFEDESMSMKEGNLARIDRIKRIIKFSPSWKYKLKSIESNIFYGDNDKLWRLPRPLFFLYYISVPFRWLGRRIHRKK